MRRLSNLNPYDQHKLLINEYILNRPGKTNQLQRDTSKDKRDADVIRENHKFLWDEEVPDTWEKQFAKKYYDKLFKEYCICELSKYEENKVALRWRIEKELIEGKGQFICGNKVCNIQDDLRSWEVNFSYVEHGEKKNALVKLRLCQGCSCKLNYHSKKREVKRMKNDLKKSRNKKHSHSKHGGSQSSDKSVEQELDGSKRRSTVSENDTARPENEIQKRVDAEKTESEHWSQKALVEELTREEEFEKYLDDLLL